MSAGGRRGVERYEAERGRVGWRLSGEPLSRTCCRRRIVHGSGGNLSAKRWRRAYVIAYRSKETVAEERRQGFTHSHNDSIEVLNSVGKESK